MGIKVEIDDRGLVQTQTEEQGPPTLKVNGFPVGGVVQTRTPEGEITTIEVLGWGSGGLESRTFIIYNLLPSDVGNMVKLQVPTFTVDDFTYEEMEGFGGILLRLPTGADCPINSVIRIMYDYSLLTLIADSFNQSSEYGSEDFSSFPFTIPFFPGALFFPDENNEFSVGEPASAQDVEYGIRISPKAMIDIMKTRVVEIDSSVFGQFLPSVPEGNLRFHTWTALNVSQGLDY